MAGEKKTVHKVQLTDGKRNIIQQLLQEYDIQSAEDIQMLQNRKSTFEPQVVKKRQKDISEIDQKIISMYSNGMTTRQISDTLEDIYVYPVLFLDAIHYSVRDNGVIRKLAGLCLYVKFKNCLRPEYPYHCSLLQVFFQKIFFQTLSSFCLLVCPFLLLEHFQYRI